MTLSNEELQQIAADGFIKHGDAKVMAAELQERRERDKQEPVAVAGFDAATAIRACMDEFPDSVHDIVEECAQIAENTISSLHAAPPAPVVPDAIEPTYEAIKAILPTANPDEYACCVGADMWNACRATMLNGGQS